MTKRHHTQKNIKKKASNLLNSTNFYSWTIILNILTLSRVLPQERSLNLLTNILNSKSYWTKFSSALCGIALAEKRVKRKACKPNLKHPSGTIASDGSSIKSVKTHGPV